MLWFFLVAQIKELAHSHFTTFYASKSKVLSIHCFFTASIPAFGKLAQRDSYVPTLQPSMPLSVIKRCLSSTPFGKRLTPRS